MAAESPVADADPAFQELIALFARELVARAQTLRDAQASGDREQLRRVAHQLKGAAGGYGFPELGTMAGIVQHGCQSDTDRESLAGMVEKLIAECESIAASHGGAE